MEFNKDFKDNTMWKNNIPSSKIKAWKKTTQRTKKINILNLKIIINIVK